MLSMKTKYGLRAVTVLAREYGRGPVLIADLAATGAVDVVDVKAVYERPPKTVGARLERGWVRAVRTARSAASGSRSPAQAASSRRSPPPAPARSRQLRRKRRAADGPR